MDAAEQTKPEADGDYARLDPGVVEERYGRPWKGDRILPRKVALILPRPRRQTSEPLVPPDERALADEDPFR